MSQEQKYDIGVFGNDVSSAMKQVTDAMRNDLDYAWSWHCNIAMASVDEGMDHYAANKAAARFLMILAGVDTTKHPGFPQQPITGEPVGQAPSVWNSIQIASWIGSQLMREPSMFERNAVCKFVRSLGRHPTLLKHSPKDTHSTTDEPVAWMQWLHGPVRVFMNIDEAMMELERLNREYPVDADDRKMRPLVFGDTHSASGVPVAWKYQPQDGIKHPAFTEHEAIAIAHGKDGSAVPLYTHPAPGVPDGYALVPIEPTDEMMAEMLGPFIAPFIAINDDNRSAFIEAYPRMLTAAQAQKGQP